METYFHECGFLGKNQIVEYRTHTLELNTNQVWEIHLGKPDGFKTFSQYRELQIIPNFSGSIIKITNSWKRQGYQSNPNMIPVS